jgi:hypothetical protein
MMIYIIDVTHSNETILTTVGLAYSAKAETIVLLLALWSRCDGTTRSITPMSV